MRFIVFAVLLFIGQPDTEPSPFDGIWRTTMADEIDRVPIERLRLSKGTFIRGAADSVKADGRFHPVIDVGYVDATAVTILGPRHVRENQRLGDRLVYSVTYRVSADGRTLTRRITDFSKPDGKPHSITVRQRRVGVTPAKGSPLSGDWRTVAMTASVAHRDVTIELRGSTYSETGLGGRGFTAVIGGPPVPITGDIGEVSVTMPTPRTIVQSMSINGRQTVLLTMTLSPDGRTIRMTGRRLADDTPIEQVMYRQ